MKKPDFQNGAVLITGLIFMVVLTLIVTASMKTTVLEEKMAGNVRDRDLAFQAAEAALRAGESVLSAASPPSVSASGPYFTVGVRTDTYWLTQHNWETSVAFGHTLTGVSSAPRYVLEEMPAINSENGSSRFGPLSESGMYKITARGVGGNPNTVVILQTTHRR